VGYTTAIGLPEKGAAMTTLADDMANRDRSSFGFGDIHRDVLRWHEALVQPGSGQIVRLLGPSAHPRTGAIILCGQAFDAMDRKPIWKLHRFDAASRSVSPLVTSVGEQVDPRFAPDGNLIAFRHRQETSDRYEAAVVQPDGGNCRSLHGLAGSIEQLEWSNDGQTLVALIADPGAPLASTQGATSLARSTNDVPGWFPSIDDGNHVPRRRIVLLTPDGASAREVSTIASAWEFCVAGSTKLAAVATDDPAEDAWYGATLRLIDLGDGSARTLYAPKQQISALSAPENGSHIAFVEGLASDRGLLAGDLRVVDVESGEVRTIDTLGVDVGWTGWRGDRLVVAGIRRDDIVVLSVGPDQAGAQVVYQRSGANGGRHYPSLALLPGDRCGIAFILQAPGLPDELVSVEDGECKTLWSTGTPATAELVRAFGPDRYRSLTWSASDDAEEIDGWIHVPEGDGPFPLVTIIHGGPVARWTPKGLLDNALQAVLARYGFALFMPNPRGSTGRGQAYAQAILHGMGVRDVRDIQSGIDMLVTMGIADPARLAVTGISHGGFMSCWMVTQDDRFRAAAAVSPITDWTSQRLTSDIPSFNTNFVGDPEGGFPSPITYANRVSAQTLIIAGARDRCTSPVQAEEFHRALRLAGKPSTLLIYPQEGHGIRSNPAAAVDHLARIVDFFCRHVLT
jgi:dipeptidyl aminopeptidase/acylaminoacyl peptidase